MRKKIIIIGGNGAMGKLFKKLWESQEHQVEALGSNDWGIANELLINADLVVVSVPVNKTCEVIQKIAGYLSSETILADFTSIKILPINVMLKYHNGPILGLHPMFGPTISSPNKQVIISCGGRDTIKSQWVIDSFKLLEFKIIDLLPSRHDEIMGFVQGIEHFSTFALGAFLKDQDLHPNSLFEISSPIYQAKLAMMGRIFDQDPKLYADIIMSDDARIELIEKYVKYLQEWVLELRKYNKTEFINEFSATSSWMGNFTEKSQLASDKFLAEVGHIYAE